MSMPCETKPEAFLFVNAMSIISYFDRHRVTAQSAPTAARPACILLLALATFAQGSATARAQVPAAAPAMTLAKMSEEVAANNPQIQQAQQAYNAARAQIRIVTTLPNATASFYETPIANNPLRLGASQGFSYSIGQPFLFPGKQRLAGESAAHQADYAKTQLDSLLPGRGPVPERYQAFRRAFGGAKAFGDYRAAIEDPDVDAVLIAVPTTFHLDLVLMALDAGKTPTLDATDTIFVGGSCWLYNANTTVLDNGTNFQVGSEGCPGAAKTGAAPQAAAVTASTVA
mgnify:CR=1 FL=1